MALPQGGQPAQQHIGVDQVGIGKHAVLGRRHFELQAVALAGIDAVVAAQVAVGDAGHQQRAQP